jgi:hypothetical protein
MGQFNSQAWIGFRFVGSIVITHAQVTIAVRSLLALKTTHGRLGSPYRAKWGHEVLLPFNNYRNFVELEKNLEKFPVPKKSIFLFEEIYILIIDCPGIYAFT